MSTSYGFIMYLATNSNEPIMMSAIFGGFIFFIWMITLSIGAAIYGCDTLWTGVVYVPTKKRRT